MGRKIQTRLKGLLLQKFKRYMESHDLSEYQAAADLIVRGLIDFEREKALEDHVANVRKDVEKE